MDKRHREMVKMLRSLGVEFVMDTRVRKHPKIHLKFGTTVRTVPMSGSPTNPDHAIAGMRRQIERIMKEHQ